MEVAIIKYNGGNTKSVQYALERIGVSSITTSDPEEIQKADKVIFPGVGEAGSAMKFLKDHSLDQVIRQLTQPVLGICLGMQLMCNYSEESDTRCLEIFNVDVVRFKAKKVPHIGWNLVSSQSTTSLLKNMRTDYFYFVHSYYAPVCDDTAATTTYEDVFSSVLQKNNFYGVQFHPEKSAEAGSLLIQNFIKL